jgi:hypothetical protein
MSCLFVCVSVCLDGCSLLVQEELVARCKALADQLVEQEALLRQQFEEKIQTIEDDKVQEKISFRIISLVYPYSGASVSNV